MQRNLTSRSFANSTQFTQVAQLVTSKVTELRSAQVLVTDRNNNIIVGRTHK
jgi:carbohydrate diacid regulator